MDILPTEVVSGCILSLLPVKDLIICSSVCHWMHDMSEDQYLWKQLVIRDFSELYTLGNSEDYKKYWQKLNLSLSRSRERLKRPGYNCVNAAEDNDLVALRMLHENGHSWDKWTYIFTAEEGRPEIFKYLHDKGCPWDEKICAMAAMNGDLLTLQTSHEQGCPWDSHTCCYAAEKGHLDCLKYAHQQGCPWDESICYYAAKGGHLECLKYLHEQGCPWDNEIL